MVDLVIGLGSLRVDIQFSRSLCDSRLRRPLIPIVQFDDLADKGQGTSSVDYNVASYGGGYMSRPANRHACNPPDATGHASLTCLRSRHRQDRDCRGPGLYALV